MDDEPMDESSAPSSPNAIDHDARRTAEDVFNSGSGVPGAMATVDPRSTSPPATEACGLSPDSTITEGLLRGANNAAGAPGGAGHPKRKPDKSKIFRIMASGKDSNCWSCSNCHEVFHSEQNFEEHVTFCQKNSASPPTTMDAYSDEGNVEDSMETYNEDRKSDCLQQNEDLVNNNNHSKYDSDQSNTNDVNSDDEHERGVNGNESPVEPDGFQKSTAEISLNEQLINSSMALEAINNTRMTLARLATAAAQENPTEKSAQDLTLLQRALYNLQHQQVIQMQLIRQLQEQLSIQNSTQRRDSQSPEAPQSPENTNESSIMSPEMSSDVNNEQQSAANSIISNIMDRLKNPKEKLPEPKTEVTQVDPRDRPLSPTVIPGNIAAAVIQPDNTPPTSEPNTLEMLKRTANQVLSNASQGLLTNRLIDDYSKNPDGSETNNKHRCRYCGKVFGSDSALQIHLRSHTGERPYKCNICGNRFTTKGNLKVHFQRHQARFPHIKMNPHPIPEHLDKLYPPLLAQLGELTECPPAPTGPPSPFPSIGPLPTIQPRSNNSTPPAAPPPVPPFDFTLGMSTNPLLSPIQLTQEKPENLTWHRERLSSSPFMKESLKMETSSDETSNFERDNLVKEKPLPEDNRIKEEPILQDSGRGDSIQSDLPSPEMDSHRKCTRSEEKESLHSSINPDLNESMETSDFRKSPPLQESIESESMNEGPPSFNHQPELRPKLDIRSPNMQSFPFPGMRFPFPLNFPFIPGLNPHLFPNSLPPPQPRPITIPPGVDPSKDPNVYNSLLPRPGSTDNSWEALIEVKKTSETMKLEELVKNIEYKLEPNQCVICHRVLSCKSALQMHYRTHTGERPFKCKICNHTFTTKGNLKTHMSVHRARPHIGMLHQCPVCHKKFGNALVLQQHIRLHTGESTDLSPEQIAAAEVRDMSSNFQAFPQNLFPPGIPLPPHHPLRGFPPFPFPMRYPISPDMLRNHEKNEEEKKLGEDQVMKLKSENQSPEREQRVAEDLSVRMRDEHVANSSPRRSISPSPSDYSDPGMRDNNSEQSNSFTQDRTPSASLSPAVSTSNPDSQSPLNLISRPPHPPFWSPFGLFPQPLSSASMSPAVPSSIPSVFSPLYMPNMPGRGNTTCKICFKTLACQSALEIHYRSHTKERPFKCMHCDRGFTTRGNMKQHLLTHKIRTSTESKFQDNSEISESSQARLTLTSTDAHSSSMLSSPSSTAIFTSPTSTLSPVPMSIPFSTSSMMQNDISIPLRASMAPFYHQNSISDSTNNPTFPIDTNGRMSAYPLTPLNLQTVDLKEQKNELMNLKRDRDGEVHLPMSKRSQSTEEARPLDLHQERPSSEAADPNLHVTAAGVGVTPPPPSTLSVQVS